MWKHTECANTHLAPATTSDFPPQPFHGLLVFLLFAALEYLGLLWLGQLGFGHSPPSALLP